MALEAHDNLSEEAQRLFNNLNTGNIPDDAYKAHWDEVDTFLTLLSDLGVRTGLLSDNLDSVERSSIYGD